MSTIKMNCIDQSLTITEAPVMSSGNQNIDKVHLDFDASWNGFIKIAVFFKVKGEFTYSMINTNGECDVPNEISLLNGKINFAVTGINADNQVLTSDIVSYTVKEGIIATTVIDGDISDEEKTDIYNKILKLANDMQTLNEDLIKNFAYVRIKGANEYEYEPSELEAQIRIYTYTKYMIDRMIDDTERSLSEAIDRVNESVQTILGDYVTGEAMQSLNDRLDSVSSALSDKIIEVSDGFQTDFMGLEQNIEATKSNLAALTDRVNGYHRS